MIFGYDIRGIYKKEIDESIAYKIGLASSKLGKGNRVVVGYDSRTSSTSLHNSLVNGLVDSGCDVVTIGMVPNPVCYFYTFHKKMDFGIYITASHLPAEYNGFKFIRNDGTSFVEELSELRRILEIEELSKSQKEGKHGIDVLAERDYMENILPKFKILGKPLIVMDCMYGASSNLAPKLVERADCKVVALRAKPLGDFNKIRPEPLPENLSMLQDEVVKNKALFGVAYDGDADRCVFVDDIGRVVDGSSMIAIFSKYLLMRRKGKIVVTIDCLSILEDIVKEFGGEIIWSKVGRTNVEQNLVNNRALFGGEQSSHFYFHDFYPFSDGILATLYLAEILTQSAEKLSRLVDSLNLPFYEKVRIDCRSHEEKNRILEALESELEGKGFELIKVDGLKFRYENCWVLIRGSNTEPAIRVSVESHDKESLSRVRDEFLKKINSMLENYKLV